MSAPFGPEILPNFARHETFHPRYGWLKKGFAAAAADPHIFHRADATTRLGVGKNMVRAIRYWCSAYKVLVESPNPDRPRLLDSHPTVFGSNLLGEHGWDPFLEEPGSLWLLHWMLLRPPCKAPAWWAIFNGTRLQDFTDATLSVELRRFCDARPEWGEVAENSLLKDARCLLRMYGSVTQGRDLLEDSVDSPFVELDLVRPVPGARRHYTVNVGPKPDLADAVVAYACIDYAVFSGMTAKVVGLAALAQGAGSPGRVFALTESAIADALRRHSETKNPLLQLTHAAGLPQAMLPDDLEGARDELLHLYYRPGRDRSLVAA